MDWTVIGLWGMLLTYPLSIIVYIYLIGKPRKPYTSTDAIVGLIFSVTYMAIVYSAIERL